MNTNRTCNASPGRTDRQILFISILLIAFTLVSPVYGQGNCLEFDGADDYVNVGNDASLNLGNTLTIEAWIKVDDLTNRMGIFSTRLDNAASSFQLEVGPGNGGVGRVAVTSPGTYIAQTPDNAISAGEWTHIAYTRNGYGTTHRIYVNGERQRLISNSGDSFSNNSSDKVIGSGTSGGQLFQGRIDELRIWDDARSQTEIRTNMHSTMDGSESDLVAYYRFDHSSGATLDDLSNNNNDGTLLNMADDDWVTSDVPFVLDYGDAPSYFPVSLVNDGPRHALTGPLLGSERDSETDGTNSVNADADGADEDGVSSWQNIQVGRLDASVSVTVQGGPARLDAWVDWNRDGNWGGPFEKIANRLLVDTGANTVNFDIPSWADVGATNARFRVSVDGDLGIGGFEYNGEVEDHQLTIGDVSQGSLDFSTLVIGTSQPHASDVFAADVDGDGDMDVLSAAENNDTVAWYENDGSQNFTTHTITTSANGANGVFAVDLDGDGDMDVLSSSENDNRIAWYENDGSENFTVHTIVSSSSMARCVYAADVDDDGDMDVLSVSGLDPPLVWHENDGQEHFVTHTIDSVNLHGDDLFPVDINGDGDMDVISCSYTEDRLSLHTNNGNESFNTVDIATGISVVSVFAADVNDDGEMDILTADYSNDKIEWWENDGSENFTNHTVSTTADGAEDVIAVDIDGDGDVDILSASYLNDRVVLYENDGSENFTPQIITSAADGVGGIFAADINGDGDVDILSAVKLSGTIELYEQDNFEVITAAVTNITDTSADCGGTVNQTSGSPITARGVCWNTTGDPTTADDCTSDGSGTGTFTSSVTGLTSGGQLYYIRAYATNAEETEYGSEKIFITPMSPPGNALDFDGINDYVDLGNSGSFNFGNVVTIEAWVKPGDLSSSGAIFSTRYLNYSGSFQFGVGPGSGGSNRVEVRASGTLIAQTEDDAIAADEWTHIAYTRSGSGAGTHKIYVNGVEQPLITNANYTFVNNGSSKVIGTGSHDEYFYSGEIDELRVWNVVRSEAEIRDNMNNLLTGEESGLIAYYRFDHSSGVILDDLTNHDNEGTPTNMTDDDWVASAWPYGVPFVITDAVTDIASTTVTCGGNVTDEGSAAVTARGVCWNTTGDPTTADDCTSDGSGTGTYTSSVTGLTAGGQTYHIRAYATNAEGTAYGEDRIFATAMSAPGNALEFDGIDDYVNLGNDSSLDLGNTLTVEAWVNADSLSGRFGIFSTRKNDNAGAFQLEIGTGNGGTNRVAVVGQGTWVAETDDDVLTTNEWTHIAYVRDGTGLNTHTIYINGIEQPLISEEDYTFVDNNSDKVIASGTNGGQSFSGLIDELRIWNTARSASEIRNSMYATLNGDESNLIAYYRFDQPSGTFLDDVAIHDNEGTLINMTDDDWVAAGWCYGCPYVTTARVSAVTANSASCGGDVTTEGNSSVTARGVCWNTTGDPTTSDDCTSNGSGAGAFTSSLTGLTGGGQTYYVRAYATNTEGTVYGGEKVFATLMTAPGNALEFDGTNDYVTLGNDSSLDLGNTLTIEAWVKPTSLSGRYGIFSTRKNNETGSFQLEVGTGYGGIQRVAVSGPGSWAAQTDDYAIYADDWTHIAYVRDGTGRTSQTIYINGVAQTLVSDDNYTFIDNNSQKVIGSGTGGGQLFPGQIDELRIWNDVRTMTEIRDNMTATLNGDEAGLVAYYRFDQQSDNHLYDFSPAGNDGYLVNMTDGDWVTAGWCVGCGQVTTAAVTGISSTAATSGGDVTREGSSSVTARGVVWDTSSDPTVDAYEGKTSDGSGTGSFTSSLTGLTSGETYYVRAYATNSAGSSYGKRESFTTEMTAPGNALEFDGVNDYVNLEYDSSMDLGNTLTIEAWVKPENLSGRYGIFSTRKNNDAGSFQLEVGVGDGGTKRIAVVAPSTFVAQTVDDVLSPNEWTHIAYTRSGTGSGTHTLYVNGYSQTLVSDEDFTFIDNNSDKVIASGTSGGQFYPGAIDELRVWNVARTETEIRDNMNQTLTGNEANLVAYYRFDHISGTVLADRTAHDNDGILQNMVTSGTENDWITSDIPFGQPMLITASVTDITGNSATCGGSVTSEGNSSVTAKGVVWGTTNYPTVESHTGMTSEGSGTGSFVSSLTGLSPGHMYYVRAYATNSEGTGYGPQKVFDTAFTPPGNALDFDGSDDYVNLGNGASLNLGNTLTVEAWVKADDLSARDCIFSTRFSGDDDSFQLEVGNLDGGTNRVGVTGVGTYVADTEDNVIAQGTWTHIAYTRSGTGAGTHTLYINGVAQTLTSDADYTFADNSSPKVIGCGKDGLFLFTGQLDEVRIWSTARTENEIQSSMYSTLNGDETDLAAYYRFDANFGTVLSDLTVNDNDGTLENMGDEDWVGAGWTYGYPYVTTANVSNIENDTAQGGGEVVDEGGSSLTAKGLVWDVTENPTVTSNAGKTDEGTGSGSFSSTITGLTPEQQYYVRAYATNSYGTNYGENQTFTTEKTPPGNALDFDGLDDYVSLPSAVSSGIGGNITVEAWVYSNSLSESSVYRAIASEYYGSDSNVEFELFLDGAAHNLTAGFYDGSWYTASDTAAFPIGGWVHAAATYDGHYIKIYRNGEIVATSPDLNLAKPTGTNGWRIGRRHNYGNPANMWNGRIDELRIWNTTRTQAEIRENMHKVLNGDEAGLVCYYKFDHDSGTVLDDRTVNNYDGSLNNMADEDWVASTCPVPFFTAGSGNWSSSAVWGSGQGAPGSGSWVDVRIGHSLQLDVPVTVRDLDISSGGVLTGGYTRSILTVTGDFTNDGTFTHGNGTVSFEGTTGQSITGSTDFYHLSVNNSATGVTLNDACTVEGTLSLLDGNIRTTGVNALTLKPTATVSGGSSASYIDGPLAKEFDALNHGQFVFPVGDGADLGECALDPDPGVSTFRARYFGSGFGDYNRQPGISGVNDGLYWQITRTSGFTDGYVTLFWDSDITDQWDGSWDGFMAHIGVLKWYDGSTRSAYWMANGGSDQAGDSSGGSVRSGWVDTFEEDGDYFTLGAGYGPLATDESTLTPRSFDLSPAYPNPFNPTTMIRYYVPQISRVDIIVFNLTGQLVEILVAEKKNPGFHTVVYDGSNQSSGIYFIRMTGGNFTEVQKVMLMK